MGNFLSSWGTFFLSSHFPRNPNYPHEFSRKVPGFASPWPDFVPRDGAESYKEFSVLLPNRQGLKKADCSFWSKYIQSLKASAGRDPGPLGYWDAIGIALSCEELTVCGGGGAPLCQGPPVLMGDGRGTGRRHWGARGGEGWVGSVGNQWQHWCGERRQGLEPHACCPWQLGRNILERDS